MIDCRGIELREIFCEYLRVNKVHLRQAAEICGVPKSTLHAWTKGERKIPPEYKYNIITFLEGKNRISVEAIIDFLEMRKNSENYYEKLNNYENEN